MYLARVIGTVVATRKVEGLSGERFLVVQPVDAARRDVGKPHVAVDRVSAGPGEWVTCVGSREAALSLCPSFVPVDAAIIGIADEVAR